MFGLVGFLGTVSLAFFPRSNLVAPLFGAHSSRIKTPACVLDGLSSRVQATLAPREGPAVVAVKKYFDAWNRRDMEAACAVFDDSCRYEDTQYAGAFEGKAALEAHLFRVAEALPPSFEFCIDEVVDGGESVGVQWHVENVDADSGVGTPLPFTRGCSIYKVSPRSGKLTSGFDVPEPAPFKPGSASLTLLSIASKVIAEPVRGLALVAFLTYVPVVFFSNGILPGPDATQLDLATWIEVRDLSLNFWLVAPLLNLPFSAPLHPGLEGIFNLLLAWAAAFGGFLADGRPSRRRATDGSAEVNAMIPIVAGMQLLTNAFYLPYLLARPLGESVVYADDVDGTGGTLDAASRAGESRVLAPLLTTVGSGSILWALFARPEFGSLSERWASLAELLSNDRLGSSFVVDLALFALFQGALIDDDLKRRGVAPEDAGALRALATFVPFFGLVGYLALRPPLPRNKAEQNE
jgi:ketosteroid isomerase-like protein